MIVSKSREKRIESRSLALGELRNILQFVFFHIQLASTHICSNKSTAKAANIQCKHLHISNPTNKKMKTQQSTTTW